MIVDVERTERKRWFGKNVTKTVSLDHAESGVSYDRLKKRSVFVENGSISVETDIFKNITRCDWQTADPSRASLSNPYEFKPTLSKSVLARILGHKVVFSFKQSP